MQNLLFDELCIKHARKQFLIFAIACVAFLSAIYTPIYLLLSNNVLWRNSIVLFLLTELVGPLTDFAFYWGSFAFLIYIYLRFGKKEIKDFAIIYVAASMARYLLSMIASFILMSFPGWNSLFEADLPELLFSTAMDCLQMLGVLLLAEYCCRRPLMRTKAYAKGMIGEQMMADCLPVQKLFDLKKPISKLCFFASLIPAGIKVLSRLYYDIFFWGLPQDGAEWLLLATYYIGDVREEYSLEVFS